MTGKINWAILGPGKIAGKFAEDIQLSDNATLYGVASRSLEKARLFSQKYRGLKYFGSYEQMVEDPEIDVVYIATPHPFHFENTMMCLEKGKAVLCEKPLGMDSRQVRTMVEKARERKVFLMEGLWTRFIPATEAFLDLIRKKEIGEIISIHADFGFKAAYDVNSRVFNKELGGGSLLDIGIYPIYLSLVTRGIPSQIKAMARMTTTNVDSYCSVLFGYENSTMAMLESTFEAETPTEAVLYGTAGSIRLHRRFHHTEKITIDRDGEITNLEIPYLGNGYLHELEEVNYCLQHGKTESAKLPLGMSLDLSAVMDKVKQEIGLRY